MTQKTLELTENARVVLEKRYLTRDINGVIEETPEELFRRVCHAVGSIEKRNKRKWIARYEELLFSKRFLPNTPTLLNAGKQDGQLSACFVLPIEDSLAGIFESLKDAALIHQSGGGTGFSFSRLRPKGSQVGSHLGVASGPVSFMRVFDLATETIKQGGARRGANMGILRVDHPDIFEFIGCKTDQRSFENFNISVGITDEFMRSVSEGTPFYLRDSATQKPIRSVDASEIWERLIRAAWECGDPGLVFLDRIGFFNPTPRVGRIEATNPCGEQPLLPYESCNLGSLNLGLYCKKGAIDWELFRADIELSIRFLDAVIDLNSYPLAECRKITLRNRKIGLGVMGFADLLLYLGMPYGSLEAIQLAEKLMSFLDREAKRQSIALAREKGAFPNWKGSLWHRLGYPPMRNATVSTVAPTGTISILAGASSGIEPIFAGIFERNVLGGERLREVHPAVAKILTQRRMSLDDSLGSSGNEASEARLGALMGPAWTPAHQVTVESHIRTQAAFQRHSDSAVSKTINLPKAATTQSVREAYELAYQLGCKGITIYRDQSRETQVLNSTVCRTC